MILHGDCIEVMATFGPDSIDAIVTDPPYGLGFMGKDWDHGVPGVPFWAEMLRVAKPGAHLLAFGGTRTVHRIATSIEDAGWEIRDTLVWAYASGFPKSLDVSKAIDKAAGAEREVLSSFERKGRSAGIMGDETIIVRDITAPATDLAREWQGWGTALKPAWEPIVLARKPLRGTVAGNVTEYGTGALNIDGCRVSSAGYTDGGHNRSVAFGMNGLGDEQPRSDGAAGRWPANVILTDPIFDGDTPGVVGGGADKSQTATYRNDSGEASEWGNMNRRPSGTTVGFGDSGTYSRFFLIPKAARTDREPVLGGHGLTPGHVDFGGNGREGAGFNEVVHGKAPEPRANVHPTVKPTDLMRHLVRLVTPPGGTVLDPFLGSGSTGLAAEMEGFEWVGIERESEYVAIAEARLNGTQRGLGLAV